MSKAQKPVEFIFRKVCEYQNHKNQSIFEIEMVDGEIEDCPRFGFNLQCSIPGMGTLTQMCPLPGETAQEAFLAYDDMKAAAEAHLMKQVKQKVTQKNAQLVLAGQMPPVFGLPGMRNGGNKVMMP